MSLQAQIDSFISYFNEFLERLRDLPDDPELAVLKKLGFVAALDGLSKVGAPNASRSRPRFVSFIREFSGWSDCERISLPHLAQALSLETQPDFEQLGKHVRDLLGKWPTSPSGPRSITSDPMLEQIDGLWPKEGEAFKRIMGSICPERIRHCHLLYTYRNLLAHEVREGGFGTIERGVPFPYYSYTHITRIVDAETTMKRSAWLLHYPLGFFSTLASTCLQRLEAWLKAERIDPYIRYRIGEFWLNQLHKEPP
jgi:hypothetical protein